MIDADVFRKLPSMLQRAEKIEAALDRHLKGDLDASWRAMLHRLQVCVRDFGNVLRPTTTNK